MKLLIVTSVIIAGILMMAVPYHRRPDGTLVRACTQVREMLVGMDELPTRRAWTVAALIILGLLAPLAPGALIVAAMWINHGRHAVLVLGGVIAILLAVLNAGVLMLEGLTFSFGGGSRAGEPTPWAGVIPAWIVICAIAMLVLSATSDTPALPREPSAQIATP